MTDPSLALFGIHPAERWEAGEDHPEPLLGAIGVALDFETWHTMVRKQGLTDEQALDLMVGMVRCAKHG